jgi:hypothetical protein
MSLYISQGYGPKAIRTWVPGDLGSPNRADSRGELSSCPQPDPLPCPRAECGNMRYIHGQPDPRKRYWFWTQRKLCGRCQNLQKDHGLELMDLITLWEGQDRRCYHCNKALGDPRVSRHGAAEIDHDHKICPQKKHSCERCRRGLACHDCNVLDLAVRSKGSWCLPSGDDLIRWLEFLGPAGRDRLRKALTLFSEQPARGAPRRRASDEHAPEAIAPLFALDDYRVSAQAG